MTVFDASLATVKVVVIFMMILNLVPLLIWMERKGAAYIQDRRGPNRADILGIRLGGIVHSLADAVKLLTKADHTSRGAHRPLFILAPMIALVVASVTVAIIPFAEPLTIGGQTFTLQIADLNAGLIYVLALSSLAVYAVLLAGWSSGGKYSLLGAMRGSAQMVSYEIAMGLAAVAIFLYAGSLKLGDIVAGQGAFPWEWNVARLPLTFILFFTALFAETNRLPFDLPEGESELAAGFHTEYSSMRFALFFLGEYAHIVVGSLLVVMLFFGGWHIPFMREAWFKTHVPVIVEIIWIASAASCFLWGLWLLRWYFKRRGFWGDRRDLESLIFAVPLLLVGVGLGGAYFFPGTIILPLWGEHLAVCLIQMTIVLLKTLFFCGVFIWVRWTLPRFRYDQLMRLGWKGMIPLAMLNIVIVGLMVLRG